MKNNKQSKTQKNIDGIVKSDEIIGAKEDSRVAPETTAQNLEVTTEKTTPKITTKQKKAKKSGFLGKTWNELSLVEWPTAKYVAGWSLTIILFTGLIGSVMGFTDYYFESGIQFIDCTSPNGSRNKSTQDCLKDLTTNITFQKYFNREASTVAPTTNTESTSDTVNPVMTEPTITADPAVSTPTTETPTTENVTNETNN
jgi:preprotein translocase subunit SecE